MVLEDHTTEGEREQGTDTGVSQVDIERPSPLRRVGKGAVKLVIGLIVLSFVVIFGSIMMSNISIDKLNSVRDSLDRANHWMQFLRWGFIAALITWWNPINTWLAKRKNWNKSQLALILNMRWFTLGILLFVELIFVQRAHEWFIG